MAFNLSLDVKLIIKTATFLLLITFFPACKKDKSELKPTRMWYWDDCKILSFKRHNSQYAIDYNGQGYPSRVSIQNSNFKTVYKLGYDGDRVVEIGRFEDNKINQKIVYNYSGSRIASIQLFGPFRDASTAEVDTIELKRVEFKYGLSEKPTSYIMSAYDEYVTRGLIPFLEVNQTYDLSGNVNKIEWESYIGGNATGSRSTINLYYDNSLATGKFLNLLFFSFTEDSPSILFSDHNWSRSHSAPLYSPPSERKIDIEYDEHGNVKNAFYGFTDINWRCD